MHAVLFSSLLIAHFPGRLRTQSELEKCVLCENSPRLALEQRRRYGSWQTLVVDSRRSLVLRSDTKITHCF